MPMQTLALLAAIILLPLVPAYILYKALPSRAMVAGPFQGVNVKLSGAFGGYFALALLSLAAVKVLLPPASEFPKYQEETFSGSVVLEGPLPEDLDPRLLQVSLFPWEIIRTGPFHGNEFTWTIKVPARRTFGNDVRHSFQELNIRYPGYFADRVPIQSGTLEGGNIRRFAPRELLRRPSIQPTKNVELEDEG